MQADQALKGLERLASARVIEWKLIHDGPSGPAESSDGSEFVTVHDLQKLAGGATVAVSDEGELVGNFFQMDFRGPNVRVSQKSPTCVGVDVRAAVLQGEKTSVSCGHDLILMATSSRERVRISPEGFVGVNTDSPSALLEVRSRRIGSALRVSHGGSLLLDVSPDRIVLGSGSFFLSPEGMRVGVPTTLSAPLRIESEGASSNLFEVSGLAVSPEGFLGINTSSPEASLHVVGDSFLEGELHVVGDSVLDGELHVSGLVLTDSVLSSAGLRIAEHRSPGPVPGASPGGGTLWVADTSPTILKFTDDSGASFTVGGAGLDARLIDQNGDTSISVEQPLGSGTDTTVFVNAGHEAMRITPKRLVGIGTRSPSAMLHVAGSTLLEGPTDLLGYVGLGGVVSPPALTEDVEDYRPSRVESANILRLDPGDSTKTVGGLAGMPGQMLVLMNVSPSHTLTFTHDSQRSSRGNRFLLSDCLDLVLLPNSSVMVIYDPSSLAWRAVR
jgi:hypothetical protein